MKLKHKDITKDGSGTITLIPEEPDDLWHAYNLISKGDLIRASTVRRVQLESSTGSVVKNDRIKLNLTIEVNNIEYDVSVGVLRVSGKNVSESKYVKMGAFHTIDLEANKTFHLTKNYWDSVALDIVEAATDAKRYSDVAAIVMSEGLAHICLITPTTTVVTAKIDLTIPRKRPGSVSGHDKGLQRFFDQVLQAMVRHIDFNVVKCVIIASPGFVKDKYWEHMMMEAQRKPELKVILENKPKFLLVHSSSGHKHALLEVLADPQIASKLEDTKALGEVKALKDFYAMLKSEPDRAFYGLKHVELANERLAIQTLLITDQLFRSADLKTRRRYVDLVESVKQNGGEVKLFSSSHVSGEQLAQLSGIAAILRFPMPEIEDVAEEEANGHEEDANNNNHNE